MFSDESNYHHDVRCKSSSQAAKGGDIHQKFVAPNIKHPESAIVRGFLSGKTGRHGLFFLEKGKTIDLETETVVPRFTNNMNLDWNLQDET